MMLHRAATFMLFADCREWQTAGKPKNGSAELRNTGSSELEFARVSAFSQYEGRIRGFLRLVTTV